jgi:hypothetical protein
MVSGTISLSRNKRYCSVMGRPKRLDVGGTIHHALGEIVPDTISPHHFSPRGFEPRRPRQPFRALGETVPGRNGSWHHFSPAPFLPGTVRQRLRGTAGKC